MSARQCWSKVAKPGYYAASLAGIYMLVASTYIMVSGWIAATVAKDVAHLARIEHVKGIVFVVTTGVLLWAISWTMFGRLRRSDAERSTDRQALMLVQSKAYAAEVAASVAHDFNNLLLVIWAGLDELAEIPLTSQQATVIAEMRQALDGAKKLTTRMANTARGQSAVRQDQLSLGALVLDTAELMKRLPRMRDRDTDVQVDSASMTLLDPVAVEQIVVNLLLNAADATSAHGKIRVSVREDASVVQLAVDDNGPGLSASQVLEVQKPFTSTKPGGLGLGLLSVRASVEATHGTIAIERSELGGARFVITWPKILPFEANERQPSAANTA
ncbi:MAG TPA: HAMP domain-containing sensor histidine kinase [Polyangiaceae bacterium]